MHRKAEGLLLSCHGEAYTLHNSLALMVYGGFVASGALA